MLELFYQMKSEGILPTIDSFSLLIETLTSTANTFYLFKILEEMKIFNVHPNDSIHLSVIKYLSNPMIKPELLNKVF